MRTTPQIIFIVFASFTLMQCSSVPKLEDNAPFNVTEVYSQNWVAGLKEGGSGTNLFVTISDRKENVVIDSVFFSGKVAKLETNSGDNSYVGRFSISINKKQDIILSNVPNAEFGNEVPKISKAIPFDLKNNECVISYKENNTTRYFKISAIKEKSMLAYPSAPPNEQ